MLFGMGFAMQIVRLEKKTDHYFWTYGRRLLVLFLFGMAHLVLASDIINRYAICGALLLFFRRVSLKGLLLWALLLMPLPYLHLAIVSTLATAETPSNMLEEAEPTEQQSNQQLEDENGDTDSGFSWNLYKGERARRVMGGQGVDGTLAQRIQPATTAQFPGLSASGAGGLPAQGRSQDFFGRGWTSNRSGSNLEGGTTRGGRSLFPILSCCLGYSVVEMWQKIGFAWINP